MHPLISSLMPTDIGWFPEARHHYCERTQGIAQHILILCVAGEGWVRLHDTLHSLGPGEALLISKDTPHVYGSAEARPWSIHWVHFMGVSADYYAHQVPELRPVISIDPETTTRLSHLFSECCDVFAANFVMQRMIYASQVLHHLLGALFFDNRSFSPTLLTSRFHNLEATRAYLGEHIDRSLTLDQMARHAGLSKSHFSRLFKEQTGYSPTDYFIHLKMQRACMLLSLSRKSIREIGSDVGYDDPYYFSRIFKRIMGSPPQAYRKSFLSGSD